MSMEQLIRMRNAVEGNDNLRNRSNIELAILGAILDDDEVPVKDFISETQGEIDVTGKFKRMIGELILTNKRILFLSSDESDENEKRVFEIGYDEMDDCFVSYNENNVEEGLFVVVLDDYYYIFTGLMRFGLSQWGDYVRKRMEEMQAE